MKESFPGGGGDVCVKGEGTIQESEDHAVDVEKLDSSTGSGVAMEAETVPHSRENPKRGWRVDGRKRYERVQQQRGMKGPNAPYQLSPMEEQYVSFRIRGFDPKRALELVDEESGRAPRSRAQGYKDAAKLEKKLGHYCADYVPVEELNDDEFDRYEDHLLQKIAMFPKESAAFAMTALKAIREKRRERKTANEGAMVGWVKECCEELKRLSRIEAWVRARPGGAFQDARKDAGHAHQYPGKEAEGDNLGSLATLEALSLVCAQERELLGVLEETMGVMRGGRREGDDAVAVSA